MVGIGHYTRCGNQNNRDEVQAKRTTNVLSELTRANIAHDKTSAIDLRIVFISINFTQF
ncbi:Uncharacterised protein [Vibrio cholerae]|nr:Uncharacterised protein [Vibrio cholerae]CSD37205.1 Uncharacterised protein [Vibrio cholerae]CSD82262.1 Uncharacterised protein [Vibrio cholerae]